MMESFSGSSYHRRVGVRCLHAGYRCRHRGACCSGVFAADLLLVHRLESRGLARILERIEQ